MNETIKRIEQLAPVPEGKDILFHEASELVEYAEETSLFEAIGMAFKLGFSAGKDYAEGK